MSLPAPTTGGPAFPLPSPAEQDAWDAPLLSLASKSGGDLRKLLFAFFSFLNRRTDFYLVPNYEDLREGVPLKMGFREGDAEKLLLAAFRQFPLRRMPRQGSGAKQVTAESFATTTTTANSAPTALNAKRVASMSGSPPSADEVSANAGLDSSLKKPSHVSSTKNDDQVTEGKTKTNELVDPMSTVKLTDKGKQIPVGNGGATDRYRWTQTISEASVIVAVPEGTRGKDLDVSIRPSFVSVRLKKLPKGCDNPSLLEGGLVERIRPDESTWSLEGGALVLILDKLKQSWWERVLDGDDVIDTSLIDSRRKINEYDDATQGAIRKILFDQRQERLGLPTSDEILGKVPEIPPLPSGVEYIDKSTFDQKGKNDHAS